MTSSSGVYFLDLALTDAAGHAVSTNFYWLTPRPDVMGPPDPRSAWYFLPIATFADFSSLAALPQTSLTATKATTRSGGRSTTAVTLKNPSSTLAFFVRARVLAGATEILPVLWDDDYVSIPPGGTKTVTASYATALAPAGGGEVTVAIDGWNVAPATL